MKRKLAFEPLPFRVNRSAQESLIDQVVRGFINAIRSGHFKAGDRLPGVRDLARELEISQMAVRVAVRQLADAGEITTRPKIGIHVAEPGNTCWRAHVLLVYMSDTYYFTRFNNCLGTHLDDAGVRMTPFMWSPREYQAGLPHIRALMDGQAIDLALVSGMAPGVVSELERRSIPFVSVCEDSEPSARAQAIVHMNRQEAFAAMITHCKGNGIRSVVTVLPTMTTPTTWLEDAFAGAGIRCRIACKPPEAPQGGTPEWVEQAGYNGMRSVLERRDQLPDLVLFTDDYAARGGLTAILEAGITVPRELQVVSWINRGHSPVFPVPLTRIEMDVAEQAEAVAALAIELLKTHRKRKNAVRIGPHFIIGKSTCPLAARPGK